MKWQREERTSGEAKREGSVVVKHVLTDCTYMYM